MGKKYLDTKEGSLEQSVLGVWQTAIEEGESRKTAQLRKEKLTKKQKQLDVDGDGEIEGSDLAKLRKKAKKEEVGLDEASMTVHVSKASAAKSLIRKHKLKLVKIHKYNLPDSGPGDHYEISGDEDDLEDFHSALEKARGIGSEDEDSPFEDLLDEAKLNEGKMKELHMLMKQGKSAEEIAKIMKVDAKTIKKLMAGYHESYEIGTDEYRKHTEDVTPGEDGEWVEAINAKNISMREALAKVWSVDEGKSPFKKEDKRGDKTLTGKKVASVDVSPTIKEKVK